MDEQDADMNMSLMLDGNAIAGELQQMFGRDLTMAMTRCCGCAADTRLGALMAFVRAPGVVLRCPACENVIVRIVATPREYYIDARGAVFMRLDRDARPPAHK
jgi:hypothetical protein